MKKTTIIFIFLFLLIVSIVYSVSPSIPFSGSSDTIKGLILEYPPQQIIEVGKTHEFHFHVFNQSNGAYRNDAQCFFHLYNVSGDHILALNTSTVEYNFDYEFRIGGGNFSDLGKYAYVAQCNISGGEAGFVSVPLLVTNDGFENDRANMGFIGISLVFIVLITLFLVLFINFKSSFRFVFFLMIFILLNIMTKLLHQIAILNSINPNVLSIIYILYYTSLIFTLFMFFYVMIIFFTAFKTGNFKKDQFNDGYKKGFE